MTEDPASRADGAAALAVLACRMLAVDPALGLRLRGGAGLLREVLLAALRGLLPEAAPWRRLPVGASAGVLRSGPDLAASLGAGRLVVATGLLDQARGGVLLVGSAERLERGLAGELAQALDAGADAAGRRVGIVALDDGREGDEAPPEVLLDRLAIHLDLTGCRALAAAAFGSSRRAVAAARSRLAAVRIDEAGVEALCSSAFALGIDSLAVPQHALRVAKVAAALGHRRRVNADDLALAARLCLGPRAQAAPAAPAPAERTNDPPQGSADGHAEPNDGSAGDPHATGAQTMASMVVEAARAGLPPMLLDGAAAGAKAGRGGGRAGGRAAAVSRGRPAGSRRGRPDTASDLAFAATLRAAIPWQAARGRQPCGPLRLRPEDLHRLNRIAPRRTTVIVAVDASGSAAHGRLAEAKGAVELMLARCYVRRDAVALVAFRGAGAAVLLPPTRAPARAKRELAALPGGGGTPLAAGLDAAADLARQAIGAGHDALIAVLTDGRANVGRDGRPDRARAEADAVAAATAIRAAGLAGVVVDVSTRPSPAAAKLAAAMAARYVPLPHAAAASIAGAVLPDGPRA